MKKNSILVSGASGKLGRQVLDILLEHGASSVIATTRTPDRHADLVARGVDVRYADFNDKQSVVEAFAGAGRILLISTDTLDSTGRRVRQHRNAIQAASESGVGHIVYTSFVNREGAALSAMNSDHIATEEMLAASGAGFTCLRNSFYMDMLFLILGDGVRSGSIFSAAGDGKVAYVAREDCARAAAAALLDGYGGRRTLDITGPLAVNAAELAVLAGAVFGIDIKLIDLSAQDQAHRFISKGMPPAMAEGLAKVERLVAQGTMDVISDDFARLTGRAPMSPSQFLTAQRAVFLNRQGT